MEKDRSNLFVGFLLGAAAGAIAGYLLAGGRKEDLAAHLKTAAANIQEELGKQFQQGQELVDELTRQAGEFFEEKNKSA